MDQSLSDAERDRIEPAIRPDLLRAWIAHAKETCYPQIEDERVKSSLLEYCVTLRSANTREDESTPVPITYRKVEAILRLAEASARVRLSPVIEMEDVGRATQLVETSMRQVGYDSETGQFDADIIETGTAMCQRDRMETVEALVEEHQENEYAGAPVELVLEEAASAGLDDGQVRGAINHLLEKGRVYKPDSVHLRFP